MLFNIGDQVLFKNENQIGVIISIISNSKFLVKTNEGFDVETNIGDIILVDPSTNNVEAYGKKIINKDKHAVSNKKNTKSKNKNKSSLIVDLHFENLDLHNVKKNLILPNQIDYCRKKIDQAIINSTINKLIIIHGIGDGILKQKVHEILQEYSLTYYLSLDEGSTEVIF
ncbi:MAG: hypothetical protein CMP69_04550 [Flavobacteriales bacterium]|nr:hypothetical protein [Flavobacteriales bacterium]